MQLYLTEFDYFYSNIGGIYSSYIGTAKATNEKVSIKQFMVQRYDPKLIVKEVANLSRLSHEAFPRVVELFHTDSSVYMVTSYVDIFRLKNIVDLQNNTTSLTLPEVRKIFKSLMSAVLHCHDQHVILRSLLPENIMIVRNSSGPSSKSASPDIDVKICDLAMAVEVTKAKDSVYSDHPLFDWTHVPYLSPEVALKLPYTFSADNWCLGVILYMMVSAHLPFHVQDPMDRALLLQKIKDSEFDFNVPVWDEVRADIKQLIRLCLMSDPLGRASIAEMRRNAWITQA